MLCGAITTSIINWQREHQDKFPKLTVLASKLGLLSVPASSAASERAFSAAGQTITERRTSMKLDNVDSFLAF